MIRSLQAVEDEKEVTLNMPLNANDGDEYSVIDVEKFDGLTLNYGYEKNGDFFKAKRKKSVDFETEFYIINNKTHQIYFPRGIFIKDTMYYTF